MLQYLPKSTKPPYFSIVMDASLKNHQPTPFQKPPRLDSSTVGKSPAIPPAAPKSNSSTPRGEQLTNQYLYSIVNKVETTNAPIVQMFKSFDYESRKRLQKFCLSEFDNLPLFLMYELGWQLGLQELSQACSQELSNENYEQLNYSKYDLIKCSFFTFRRILDEYNSQVKTLEIQGLRQSDLKSVIDDYCMMSNVQAKDKENLYNQFVNVKENLLTAKPKTEIRRSMVETSKSKMDLSTPLKSKNTLYLPRTPMLSSTALNDEQQQKQQPFKKSIQGSQQLTLDQSAQLVKLQIEDYKQKQALLYSQIIETRKQCADNKNDKFLKQSFAKLEKTMQMMQNQIKIQNEKIEKLRKSASDIKASTTNSKKIDFVFSF